MASNSSIYTMMRVALIPAPALSASLASLHQPTLVKEITEGRFCSEELGLTSYLIQQAERKNSPTVVRVCSVMAKELVLLNRPVRYTMVSELVRLASGSEEDWYAPGHGYLVLGDVGENTKAWSPAQWEDAQAYVLQHIRRGGAVIIGDTGAIEHGLFNREFIDALDQFVFVKVQ